MGGQLFNDFYLRFVEGDFKEEPDRICALFRPVHGPSHVVACNVTWRISNLWNVLEVSNCCSCNKTCILPKSWAIFRSVVLTFHLMRWLVVLLQVLLCRFSSGQLLSDNYTSLLYSGRPTCSSLGWAGLLFIPFCRRPSALWLALHL